MGKWIVIWGAIALVGWLIAAAISASQKSAARKYKAKAKALLDSGDWESAAALFKKAILERLDKLSALQELTDELIDIYKTHGIDADLTHILDAPDLIKQIWNTNTSPKEKGRFTGKLYSEIAQLLDRYPGQIES